MNLIPLLSSNLWAARMRPVFLVDEVRERYALVLILLRHGDDEAEVRTHELVQRLFLALADELGQACLLGTVDQRVLADLLEVLVERSVPRRSLPGREAHGLTTPSLLAAAPAGSDGTPSRWTSGVSSLGH